MLFYFAKIKFFRLIKRSLLIFSACLCLLQVGFADTTVNHNKVHTHHIHKKKSHTKHSSRKTHHHHHYAAHRSHKNTVDFASTAECVDPALADGDDTKDASPSTNIALSVEKNLVNFVHDTVENLHYSVYKLGGKRFDTQRGVYIVDCSTFVDHVLQTTTPHAYSSLVNATGADMPASEHYYHFFKELSDDPDSYWNKVSNVAELRPGDILVFRYKNRVGTQTGGHVMVVMDKPIQDSTVYLVRVADSAPSGHSKDTREENTSGIGIGTLLLKANPKTGRPSAYAWGLGGYWNRNVSIAMARPTDVA